MDSTLSGTPAPYATSADANPYASPTAHKHAKVVVFLEDACFKHRFIRSRDTSNVVERPERLRAVRLGLSAAISRLSGDPQSNFTPADDGLAGAFERLSISASSTSSIVSVVRADLPQVALVDHPAVKYVHGDDYLKDIQRWAEDSADAIARGESEIPENLPQGDLYRERGPFLSPSFAAFLPIELTYGGLQSVPRPWTRCTARSVQRVLP